MCHYRNYGSGVSLDNEQDRDIWSTQQMDTRALSSLHILLCMSQIKYYPKYILSDQWC